MQLIFAKALKILYLHQYFRTPEEGGGTRSYYLAKALADAGHEVVLLSAHNQPHYRQVSLEGFTVHYLPVFYDNRLGFWERLQSFFGYARQVYRLVRSWNDIDIVYATSTPLTVGWLAYRLYRRKGWSYFFEVRDLWPQAPIEMGYFRYPFMPGYLYRWERKIYQHARQVIALSPGIQAHIQVQAPSTPTLLIPNFADTDFFRPSTALLSPRFSATQPFVIAYTGTFGRANGLDAWLEVIKSCPSQWQECVKWVWMGEGAEKALLMAKAQQCNLRQLSFLAPQNKTAVKQALEQAQAALVSFLDRPVLQTSSPNKFFEALAAGKLLIVNTDGWLRELVEKHACGIYIPQTNPVFFWQKLIPYLENTARLQAAQINARALAEQSFASRDCQKVFVDLFASVSSPKTGS
ncbi:MAG: glycosyltransferase family 4 protein [Microscillaceae bacterium]|nr:glycosyltransferase family 4 protein [Microscillaceae bacterium]